MITLLSNVSFVDALSNLDFKEFYTLTYWGLGIVAVIILLIIISGEDNHEAIVPVIIFTVIVVGAVEIYHSRYRLEKRIAENEARELREQQRNIDEKRRQESCTFEYAKKKADAFMESTGFKIVQSMKPSYLALPADQRNEASCSADFKYIVQVPQQNYQTGSYEMSQRLYIVELELEKFQFSYEFLSATIEDQITKKKENLLR